jgi:two-component system cell cycle sensor histidine kinase/response regulator CckA
VLQPRALDINEVVRSMDGMLLRLLGPSIERHLVLGPDAGMVVADRSQLEQVIMNLVLNARDAMPAGGTITIATRATELARDAFHDRYAGLAVPPGAYAQLSITDTGSGMDEQTRLRVFEPFFTTKEQGKGTGLGLSMVYGIVKQSDGYVWADSAPGAGTTFDVYLPAAPATGVRRPTPPSAAAPAEVARGTTVLLVEDEEGVRRAATRMLTRAGYEVVSAEHGRAALALLAEQAVDIVLSDISMPDMDGTRLVAELRRTRPELPVVLMSGHPAGTEAGMADVGVTPFLQKPFSADDLLATLRTALARATR